MDYNTWCKLCGSVDAILKPDKDQEEVIFKLTEVKNQKFKISEIKNISYR